MGDIETGLHPHTFKGVTRAWRLPMSRDVHHPGSGGHTVRRRPKRADAPPLLKEL